MVASDRQNVCQKEKRRYVHQKRHNFASLRRARRRRADLPLGKRPLRVAREWDFRTLHALSNRAVLTEQQRLVQPEATPPDD